MVIESNIKPAYEPSNKISQNQFFEFITGDDLGWQTIIYDLIRTEQLDPWDIDIGVLADKYVETIQKLEEANFFVSSKVLLACSLLLRLKSEILANNFIQSLDEALYGKEEKSQTIERIDIDEGELPVLVAKTPMSRHKKVTLNELINALNKAIETENRRIRREITQRQAEKLVLSIPKTPHIPLKIRMSQVFSFIQSLIKSQEEYISFSSIAKEREEKIACFVPVLHLANESKVYLRQKNHFDEIYIGLKAHEEELKEIESELSKIEEYLEEIDEKSIENLEEQIIENEEKKDYLNEDYKEDQNLDI